MTEKMNIAEVDYLIQDIGASDYSDTYDARTMLRALNTIKQFENKPPEIITMRDMFAMHALTGFCSNLESFHDTVDCSRYALASYRIADAMLEHRSK